MKERNILKCPECGFAVLTEADSRYCARCETLMEFVKKEGE